MTGWESRWAMGVLEAVMPPLDGAATPTELELSAFLDEFLARQPALLRWGLRFVLIAFQLLPFLVVRRLALFHGLSRDLQERYFDAWYDSRFYLARQGAMSIKSLAFIPWAGHPATQRALGIAQHKPLPAVDRREPAVDLR